MGVGGACAEGRVWETLPTGGIGGGLWKLKEGFRHPGAVNLGFR